MKKVFSLVLVLMLLLSANVQALSGHLPFEADFDFQRILNPDILRENANDFIEQEYGRANYFAASNIAGKPFNTDSDIIARSMLVYGEPHGDVVSGTHRFLGHTMDDDAFTNVHFPHDAWAGGGLETRNWISEPWDDDEVKAYTQNTFGKAVELNSFNGNSNLENSIKAGLDYRYHDLAGAITANTFKQDWYQYVHIYQPPTPYTWGMGVMFHKTSGGQMWYMSVPLAPLAALPSQPDFEVVSLVPGTEETEPGAPYTGTVVYQLKDTAEGPVKADLILTHNGYPIINETNETGVEFEPGDLKDFTFNWTGQSGNSTIRAEIWPVEPANLEKEQRDADPDDNVLEMVVPRAGYKLTIKKTGQGTTIPAAGVHYYPANERVDLSAAPETGWKFVRWEGDISSGNPDTSIIMDADKEVTAVFERATHTLKIIVNIAPGGTTTPKPGTHTFGHGETVNIKAIPSAGWKFNGWKGDASGTNPNVNILMDRDKTIIAEFEQNIPQPMEPGKPGGLGPPKLVN